jgi:acyl dehydratase
VSDVIEQAKKLVGTVGEPVTAPYPITADNIRRFTQAVMDPNPVFWDEELATSRYQAMVAPPLYVTHVFVRPPGTPDPLDELAGDPDWDGAPREGLARGLPPLDLPFKRLVNGGTEAEFFQLPKVGDVVTCRSRYADITQREGKSGPMVLVKVATDYTNQGGELLAVVTKTAILR